MGVDDGVFNRYSLETAWIKGVSIFGNLKISKGLSHLVETAENSCCSQIAFALFCVL
jgi:hypothetical protein